MTIKQVLKNTPQALELLGRWALSHHDTINGVGVLAVYKQEDRTLIFRLNIYDVHVHIHVGGQSPTRIAAADFDQIESVDSVANKLRFQVLDNLNKRIQDKEQELAQLREYRKTINPIEAL